MKLQLFNPVISVGLKSVCLDRGRELRECLCERFN